MARRKRRKKDGIAGNLDSLLDTMTSVVGILIIILIVIQLGVKEKIKELVLEIETKEISAEEVKQKEDQLKKLSELIKTREAAFLAKNKEYKAGMTEVKALERKLADAERLLVATKNTNADPAKITKDISLALKQIKTAEAELESVEVNEAKLKKLLDAYRKKKKIQPDKSVKLPNPRPAKDGSRGVYFICKGGRVFYRDDNAYREFFQKKVDFSRAKKNKAGEYDPNFLMKYFSTRSKIAPFGKFEYLKHSTNVMFKIQFSRSMGESKNFLFSKSSRFQRQLRTLDRNKYYVVFQVQPDSYDVYLKARSVAEQLGYSVGWQPMNKNDWDYNLWTPMLIYGAKKIIEARKKNPPPKKPVNVLD